MSFRIFSELQKTATITKLNLQLYKRKGKAKLLSFNVRSALLLTIIAALIIPSLNSNFTEANNLPVIQKTGTLQQDETWTAGNVYMVTGMVIVPDTVSLTVEQGAIVKFVNYYQANITVNTGGTLNATGTASDPVVFTSYKDDSIGGDSNGDGVSSGAVNDYAKSLQTSGGDINITHGDFRYATTAIDGNGASQSEISITDTSFSQLNSGVKLSSLQSIILERNDFDLGGTFNGIALQVNYTPDISGILLAGADTNTFTGNAKDTTFETQGSDIPASSIMTVSKTDSGAILKISSNSSASAMVVDGTLTLKDEAVMVLNAISNNNGVAYINGTVNLQAGSVVKHLTTSYGMPMMRVYDGGTLNATGTASDPVVFTSYKDDSIGGDSNGDGASSGTVNDYSKSLQVNGGDINIAYGNFRYATDAIDGNGNSISDISITDTSFSQLNSGVKLSTLQSISLKRNQFALGGSVTGVALRVEYTPDISGIILSGSDTNTFVGNTQDTAFEIRGSNIPINSTMTVSKAESGVLLKASATSSSSVMTVGGTLNLEDGTVLVLNAISNNNGIVYINGTVNLQAGSIVKHVKTNYGMPIFRVNTGGTLNATGTASDPVVFTSYKDDSIGGDSNGDGVSSGAVNDYAKSLQTSGGDINITHGDFRYATTAIDGNGASQSEISITDTSFSQLNSGVTLSDLQSVLLERNNFDLGGSTTGVALRINYTPDISDIALSGPDANTFLGNSRDITFETKGSNVPAGSTLTVSKVDSGVILKVNGDTHSYGMTVDGTLTLKDGAILMPRSSSNHNGVININGTVNLQAGSTVKHEKGDYGSSGIRINTGGTLNATGTASDPVVFTSYKDDSIGGDSNGDGASSGTVNDYSKSLQVNGGDINIAYGNFRYATDAIDGNGNSISDISITDTSFSQLNSGITVSSASILADNLTFNNINDEAIKISYGQANLGNTSISSSVNGLVAEEGSEISFRGSFDSISGKAVQSCDWGEDCAVDASYVDWGSVDGPLPSTGDMVCGQVAVSPWVYNSVTYDDEMFAIENCDGTSPAPISGMNSSISYFQQEVNEEQIDCNNGFQDACDAIENAYACLGGAMSVAQSTTPWPLPPADTAQNVTAFSGQILESASTYVTSQATVTVTGFSFGVIVGLLGVVDTLSAMDNAYDNCAP